MDSDLPDLPAAYSAQGPQGRQKDADVARLRVPPQSIEAEQSVLGGLLIDNSAWDRAGDLLSDHDFYRYEHKLIYAAIGALVGASKPADVITVHEQLQNLGKADAVGGLPYLNALAQSVPSAANLRRYAEIVRERSILRKLVEASDEIATNAFNPQGRTVSTILDEAEGKIFRIGEEGSRNKQGFQSMDNLVVQLIDRVQELAENGAGDVTGVPCGFFDLDRMTAGLQPGDLIILAARPSMGKAQPLDARVRTLTGWKAMGELAVGDALASVDGRSSIVAGVYPQGERQVYRITFSDGRSTECCAEHLWRIHSRHWKTARVVSTTALMQLLQCQRHQGRLWIDRASGDFGHHEPLPVDGHAMGSQLWADRLKPQASLPRQYLEAHKGVRLDLLQGLLGGCTSLATTSRQLAHDAAELVRSLGGWCSITSAGSQYVCHMAYPASVGRQKRLTITSIEPTRRTACQCIAVSHPDRLYITDQDVVTHNTAFALNIGEHVAVKEQLPVVVFSMEMGASQLALRVVGSLGRIDQQHLRTGALRDDEWGRLSEAVDQLRNASIFIDETPALNPAELRARARRQARQCGKLGLIIVDYLQLMSGTNSSNGENRATEISEISRGLKALAKELQCPVMALSQLNRSVETRTDKRPMMSDLRESGAIEQDADVIMFIYRDDYYNKESKEPGVAEIIIGKQRNGPVGTVKLAFMKPLTKFENLAPGSYDDPGF
ncbi:replicative DNA helicase [Leptothrix ochracea]|uniref:replicative DNA helicase n=1 Tax=Leptothrix ochracea TaxID=735331 RepID=UPI0034E2A81E